MSELTDKIRKLIAKANGTTNAAEAAAFMNKATELMEANGLDMDKVDLASIKEARVKSRFSVSKPKDYEITLMSAIASSFGCELLWQASHSLNKHTDDGNYADVIFVGPKDRLELATYAADVLGRQLFKARADYSNAQSKKYWDVAYAEANSEFDREEIKLACGAMIRKQITVEANSFAIGWVMEIRKTVTRFAMNDREVQLIGQYVTAHVGKNEDGSNKEVESNQTKAVSSSALRDGQDAAKNANLHRPVSGSSQQQHLLGDTKQLGHG